MRNALLIVAIAGVLGCTLPAGAQIVPHKRAKPAVADATMVFEDRGQALEIYPTLRATPVIVAGKPGVEHAVAPAEKGAALGPRQLGVVFNHALRTRGFLTGEIALRPQGEGLPAGLDAASLPGLAKLANPNTWVVAAASPQEFLALFHRLKARTDLEWIEAVVLYGATAHAAQMEVPPPRDPRDRR